MQGFRLSPQQQQLWLLQHERDVYCAQCAMMLVGEVHLSVLEAALQTVVARHEMLRTAFPRQAEMAFPLQYVAASSLPAWDKVDLQAWSAPQQAAHIEALLQQERYRPCDLERGPLLRVTLLTLATDRHALLVSLPALCADAWTLQSLGRELSQAYTACLQGQQLSDEPTQYVHFSEWQNALLEDEDAEPGKAFWHKRELRALAAPILPFAKRVDGIPGFAPDVFVALLDPELVTQLRLLVQHYATSMAAVLLAGWQTLLWRLTGQSDMRLGYVCDGRKFAELHSVFGLLAKWVPLQSHLEANYAYRDVVARAHAAMHEAYLWQEYYVPDERQAALAGAMDLCIGFEFTAGLAQYQAVGVSFAIDQQFVCGNRFTVHLAITQQGEALRAAFYYDTNVFDSVDISCLAGQLQTLLASVTRHPDAMLETVEMLSQEERHRLLVACNATTTDAPPDRCIHHLFEAQTARTPEKIAVVCAEQFLTYAALNARANQLAHYLQRLGVKPEVRVAMCLEGSLEAMVGLLGILKAGAAYVPLDPAQPPERLAALVVDTQAPVVLTQQHLEDGLRVDRTKVICLVRDWGMIAQESAENTHSRATSAHLAYVMYTSGSTGKPKGVAVEHRQLLNYLQAIVARLELPPAASFALVSTLAADLGHTVIFPALCQGGCLHIVSQEHMFAPEALATYFRCHAIDCLKIVPSHLTALLASEHPAALLPRQHLVLGGEACGWEVIETVQALAPACRIFNHYGPTEATVGVMTYRVEDGYAGHRTVSLPLGAPLANTQVYILDAHLQPVPVGVTGELYLGGAGLTRGYLHAGGLTAEKFMPHPCATTPGARLYKTGDRARFLPNGQIEFLGRVDSQVKLRGFRIELGEIESALSQHQGVRETVVVASEDSSGSIRLVAYVVPRQQPAPPVQDLRHFMQQKLPDYMVPAVFVCLPALPLTPNGKVNRHALLAPEEILARPSELFVAPRSAVEEILAGIWAEVLGCQQVGVHDNFFALGGHSLLGIQVLSRVRKAFQVEVPPRDLFEAPTVASLAEALVKYEAKPGQIATIARVRQEIEKQSADDIRELLQAKGQARK